MKKGVIIFSLLVFVLNLFKRETVFYTPIDIPGPQMAITIPPFGIIIEKKYENERKGRGSILNHEKVHWMQYREYGLLGFYGRYFDGYLKYGRKYSPMEKEARELSYFTHEKPLALSRTSFK